MVTAVNHFFQDLPPEEFSKLMTAKWKERMLVCIAYDLLVQKKDYKIKIMAAQKTKKKKKVNIPGECYKSSNTASTHKEQKLLKQLE